jgi:hypothetical protein
MRLNYMEEQNNKYKYYLDLEFSAQNLEEFNKISDKFKEVFKNDISSSTSIRWNNYNRIGEMILYYTNDYTPIIE